MEPKSESSSETREPTSIRASFVLSGSFTQCISSGVLVFLLTLGLCFLYVRFSHTLLGSYAIRSSQAYEILPPPELAELFRRGDWELEKTTRIIQYRNLIILVSKVVNSESDRIICSPCTILFFPANETDLVRRIRAVIKMRVRGTVEITMDRSGSAADFGEVSELQVPGRLEIVREGDPSRPEESFFLSAENVSVNRERLWTPGDFSVRYGRHSGEGTGLRLTFLPSEEGSGISFSNMDQAEVQKLKYATFASGAFRSNDSPQSESQQTYEEKRDSLKFLEGNAPVSVTCRGQVSFRFADGQLSLLNDVRILQGDPESPTSQMSGENLTLELIPPPDSVSDPSSQNEGSVDSPIANSPTDSAQRTAPNSPLMREFSRMKIRRFEAIGYPAKMYSASDDLYVEAKTIQYDAASHALKMTNLGSLGAWQQGASEQEDWLVLRQGTSQFETRQLQCTLRPGEGLVRCNAQAGRLSLWPRTSNETLWPRSGRRDPADAQLHVVWSGRMELEPESTPSEHGESRRLSLTGDVSVTGTGRKNWLPQDSSQTSPPPTTASRAHDTNEPFQVLAGSVSIWLGPTSTNTTSQSLEPRRLHAVGSESLPEVQMVTDQLTGHFEDVQLWFESPVRSPSVTTESRIARPIFAQVADTGTVLSPPVPILPAPHSEETSLDSGSPRSAASVASTSNDGFPDFAKDSRFDLRAARLQAKVLLPSNKPPKESVSDQSMFPKDVQIQELRLNGRVYLEEQPRTPIDEEPLRMNCEQLNINDASDLAHAMFHLEGTPVKITGRQIQFESNTLTVDRGTRQAYAQGAGTVTLHPSSLSPTSSESIQGAANTVVEDASNSTIEQNLMSGMAMTGPVTISWKERMQLQGSVLTFESVTSPVEVDSGEHHLRTDSLSVVFRESPLSGSGRGASRENVDRIRCGGLSHYQGRSIGKDGLQRGEMELIVSELEVDQEGNFTAETTSTGEGFFRVVQLGDFLNMRAMDPNAKESRAPDPGAKTAVCGTFHERMWGNLHQKHLTLKGQVLVMSDRVGDWSDRLIFGGAPIGDRVNLSCNQLSFTLLPTNVESTDRSSRPFSVECAMTGGAEVSHRLYTATAAEIKYSEVKNILTLQGTDLVHAKIYFSDATRGREPYSSRTIQYNPVTQRISLDGVSVIRATN